ncbi:hypothetical protein HIM_03672 [Hirsutella minnesotensis 3608]|uniref:RRM domain-containing protein n=1 Tax=Hirsutella minnesotensis 3608 TaxID=1043627 RepID=A0A0F7ZQ82_9HYPO|nr:hypothetical protein HIM_03672 [Hirsutella minnesotensis 3608]
MTEPEAELQATANLSPVSPSPLHTAAPLVVPALQDTVDTIDAMVAAAADAIASNGVDAEIIDPAITGQSPNDLDQVVDGDGFDETYAQDSTLLAPQSGTQPQLEPTDSNDDYAKTFDSPVEPEEGVERDSRQHEHVASSSMAPECNKISLPSEQLDSNRAPDVVNDNVAHDTSAAQPFQAAAHDSALPSGPPHDSTSSSAAPFNAFQQQKNDEPVTEPEPAADPESASAELQDSSIDIQKLVADLTGQNTDINSDPEPSDGVATADEPAEPIQLTGSTRLPSSSSLPPRPPLPQMGSQSYISQQDTASASIPGTLPSGQILSHTLVAGGAPGASTGAVSSLPNPPATASEALPAAGAVNIPLQASKPAPEHSKDGAPSADYQRHWDQFTSDERQYMSDAKWDRFPEGSRLFIGNLSSDKVSKRDVFDVFHKYGRLAQISLKSAYGFVQYHTVDEGRRAMESLQSTEIKGRRIHLEVSRAQEKGKKDRGGRSPDRARGREGGRRGEKHHQGRDDYRPGRANSPRRNDHHTRDGNSGRGRGHDSGRGDRGRSRSPGYGRNHRDSYRRRSPSPHGRSRHEPELDLPRRYGADVPDVQMILQPEVSRDFATWVESAFKVKGLKTEVMYLHPRFPKDQVIQRQAAEGVLGVVDLDLRAQGTGRIPLQAFDRTAGGNNIRFDQYMDLDPSTATEVILRAKVAAAGSYGQGYSTGPGGYANPYAGQHQHISQASGYPGNYPAHQPPQQHQPSAADISSFMGQLDNATLQRLLSSMQGSVQTRTGATNAPGGYGVNPSAAGASPQVDIQSILSSLGGSAPAPQHGSPQGQYGPGYGAQPPAAPSGGVNVPPARGDAAAQVQNIMAQLARYRQ